MTTRNTTTRNEHDPDQQDAASTFVEQWATIWRDHDGERWPDLLHEKGILRNPLGEVTREQLPDYMAGLVASIDEHRLEPLRWGATEDGVLIEWLMTGRRGGSSFEVHGADRFVLHDGRAVEGAAYFDPRPLLPAAAGSGAAAAPGGDIEAFAHEYDQAWRAKDPDAIVARHAEGGTFRLHLAGAPEVRGREAMREAFAASIAHWRELAFTSERALYGDSFYVWESTLHGVLARPLELGAITIPANGARVAIRGVDVITIDDQGLIGSKETYVDILDAANQAVRA